MAHEPTTGTRPFSAPTPGMPARFTRLRFMSADAGAAGTAGAGGGQGGEGSNPEGFEPITTQDALNRVIGDRIARARAPFADYDDLKAKAGRVDEAEQAVQTATAEVPSKVAAGIRDALVSLGVVAEDRKVLLTATEPDALLEQVKAIQGIGPNTGGRDAFAGRTASTSTGADPMREFTRGLFGRDND